MLNIWAFQPHQRAQGLGIVIPSPVREQCVVERFFPGMAEGRMADIVREALRLDQILVEPERARDGARDLRDFEAVGQADAIMIAIGRDEHLRLVPQPPERDRMDDPVAIALEHRARPALLLFIGEKFAAASVRRVAGKVVQFAHSRFSPPISTPSRPRNGSPCCRRSA